MLPVVPFSQNKPPEDFHFLSSLLPHCTSISVLAITAITLENTNIFVKTLQINSNTLDESFIVCYSSAIIKCH